jgi:site-specific recombinase XerD
MDTHLTAYLDHLRSRGLAAGTVRLRQERLQQALGWFRLQGILNPAALRPEDIDGYLQSLTDRHLARATIVNHRTGLRGFCAWLAATGRVLVNPAMDLDPVPRDEVETLPPDPLSAAEVAALIEGIPRQTVTSLRNRAHVEMLYGTGLRLSESLGLLLSDVDLGKRMVFVRGKGGHERLVPYPAGMAAALADYLALRRTLLRGPDRGFLFLSEDGNPLSKAAFRQWLICHARQVLGKERRVFPHLLRHSYAVALLLGKADIRYVQELLGHADLDTTKLYLRLLPEHLRADYERAMPELLNIQGKSQ